MGSDKLFDGQFVYIQNDKGEFKTYAVCGDTIVKGANTIILLEDSNLERISAKHSDLFFDIDYLTYFLSYKNAILKEKQYYENVIKNHKGTFGELSLLLKGYNEDEELFDINSDCGVWTVTNRDGIIALSSGFEMYDSGDALDIFDISLLDGDISYNQFNRMHWAGKGLAIDYGFNWEEFARTMIDNELIQYNLKTSNGIEVDGDDITYYFEKGYWNNLSDTQDNINDFKDWVRDYLI